MIRRGELAEPVKGATLTGDPLGLLGQIESVAGDFVWDVSASRCDVAGQAVPVTMGAPHVRLVEADIGAAG
jgi:TldD protein